MLQQLLLLFFLSFSFQSACMINSYKPSSRYTSKILAKILADRERRSACLGMLRPIPFEVVNDCMGNLDYKSNMRLIMTCKRLYTHYVAKNDVLFTKHYLNESAYTDAMIHFARKEDTKKIELLMAHEGPINKKNREDVQGYLKSDLIVDIYKKKYNSDDKFLDEKIRDLCINHNAFLKLILKQGYKYDFNTLNEYDNTKLRRAAFITNDIAYVKSLLLLDQSLVDRNIQDKYGCTALYDAVEEKNVRMVQLFLTDPYVDCNIQNKYGCTALYRAVEKDKIEAIKFFLADPKVDRNITDNRGDTFLHLAVERENAEIIKLFIIDPYVDCNSKNKNKYGGDTPLHLAAKRKNIEIIKLFLANPKVDRNIQDKFGYTALHHAVRKKSVALLAQRTSFLNKHPMIYAISYAFFEMVTISAVVVAMAAAFCFITDMG